MFLNNNFDLVLFLKNLRVSGTRFLIKQFVIKKHVSNCSTKFDQTIVHLYIFFWNTFSEPKKTKDTKEAVIEDKNLEKTIEESNLNDVGLWLSEISELSREYSLHNGSKQRQSYNSNFKNSAVIEKDRTSILYWGNFSTCPGFAILKARESCICKLLSIINKFTERFYNWRKAG